MRTQNAIDYIKKESSFYSNERYQWLRELIYLTLENKLTDDKIKETLNKILQFKDEEIGTDLQIEGIEENKEPDATAYIIFVLFLIWKPLGFSGKRLKKIEI